MSNIATSGRQSTLFFEQVLDYTDLTTAGVALINARPIELPPGAIPLRGSMITETNVTGGGLTAITLAIGSILNPSSATPTVNATKYLAATSVFSGAGTVTPLTITQVMNSAQELITFAVVLTGGTAPTAGQVRVLFEYIISGRATEVAPSNVV